MTDEAAAKAIEQQMERMRRVVADNGVFGYLTADAAKKDVNKAFLVNTIRSVDSHNRRHEEAKCWRQKDLEERVTRRSRSRSRERKRRRRRRRSRSRSRSRSQSQSQSRSRTRRTRSKDNEVDERAYWAAKKASKTKSMWEQLHQQNVTVENAPKYDESSSSDDEDDRKVNKKRKKKKHKKEKKHKK